MIFETRNDWEVIIPFPELFKDPEARIYRAVEISLNVKILHVDILLEDDTDDEPIAYYQRLIVSRTQDALDLVSLKQVKDHWISLQTPKGFDDPNEEYSIWRVKEIYEAEGHFGQRTEVFVGVNNSRFIASATAEREGELKNMKLVYSKDAIDFQ